MHVATLQAFSWLTTYPLTTVPYLVTSYSAPASFPFLHLWKTGLSVFQAVAKPAMAEMWRRNLDSLQNDSLLYNRIKDQPYFQKTMTLREWEHTWQMEFNPSKCSSLYIRLNRQRKVQLSSYFLHGQTLEATSASKYGALPSAVTSPGQWPLQVTTSPGHWPLLVTDLSWSLTAPGHWPLLVTDLSWSLTSPGPPMLRM